MERDVAGDFGLLGARIMRMTARNGDEEHPGVIKYHQPDAHLRSNLGTPWAITYSKYAPDGPAGPHKNWNA